MRFVGLTLVAGLIGSTLGCNSTTQAGLPDGGTTSSGPGSSTAGTHGATSSSTGSVQGTSGATSGSPSSSTTGTSGNPGTSTTSTSGTPGTSGTSAGPTTSGTTGVVGTSGTSGPGSTTSGGPGSSGTTGGVPCASGCGAPPPSYCQDSNTQVTFGASIGCVNNLCQFPTTATACAFGCVSGSCAAAQTCTPNALRCSGVQVEVCNPTGSAWLVQETCPASCNNGLCDAPCTPDAGRCSGDTVQTCSSDGTTWNDGTTCANACLEGTCLQTDLIVDGNTVVLSGENHFTNSVVVKNGGVLQVGASGSLGLYAPTIDVEVSSSIMGNGGDTLDCTTPPPPDNVTAGIRLVGAQVQIDGAVYWSYSCTSEGVLIRADSISGSGTVYSSNRNLLLYGAGGLASTLTDNDATKSLMPPNVIASAEYPAGAVYNDDGPPPSFTWDNPYSTVAGYYYTWAPTAGLPTPTSTLNTGEALALPTPPDSGFNYLDVVTFDSQGVAGIVPHQFAIQINSDPPTLSSTTNPIQGSYTTNTSVVVAWAGGNAGQGYYYDFDAFPSTEPTAASGTSAAANQMPPQILMQNVSDGRQWFHMVAADSMGYLTKVAAHYEVDIGEAPDAGTIGTIAGTVLDQGNQPIVGATVVLQRGLASQSTVAGGVFTFGATIPVGTYEVVATYPGMQSQALIANVTAGGTSDENFQLQPGTGCPSCSDACSSVYCPQPLTQANCAGLADDWTATCDQGVCAPTTSDACPYGICEGNACSTGADGYPCTENANCASDACTTQGVCYSSCGTSTNEYCAEDASSYYCCIGTTCIHTSQGYQCQ